MIEIKSLNKKYTETEVLKNINYTFLEGKVYFVVGPSGCGKTTLLNILGGVDLEYDGLVLYDFEDIKEYTPKEKESFYTNKVSYISQFPALFQDISVQNNLELISFVNKIEQCLKDRTTIIKNTNKRLSIKNRDGINSVKNFDFKLFAESFLLNPKDPNAYHN